MAGANILDDGQTEWVCSMGHLVGLIDQDWLGIPSSGKLDFLRYVDFHKITDEQFSETASFVDIISIMQQVGLNPLPLQTGASIITPGPQTHDGLMFSEQDPVESARTMDLIRRMIGDLLASGVGSLADELGQTWHEDMLWWGPRPNRFHPHGGALPGTTPVTVSRRSERDRVSGPRYGICHGKFWRFFWLTKFDHENKGGSLGLPASDITAEMRLVDIYRRDGGKLAENWIFIDLLHFLYQQELDVLGRMKRILKR